ncbi:unnamed protein product [Rhizoctonia solani]|uniref:Uncharacterized protein n=1 Tax=Rhizoctonia solani TaxID=456999 RepID=A0A8H2X325_9AGAM|nr:unnamed protein product [Rhizoctonia solani]
MENGNMRIHCDDQVGHQVGSFDSLPSAFPLRLCEEQTQVNQEKLNSALPWSLRSSDSDQLQWDELSPSDKLNISKSSNLCGFPRRPSPFEGAGDGASENPRNNAHLGRREVPILRNLSQGRREELAPQAPEHAEESAFVIPECFSAPEPPSSHPERQENASDRCQSDQPTSRDVGTLCQVVAQFPTIKTVVSGATSTSKRGSATESNFIRQDNVDSSHSLRSKSQSAEVRSALSPMRVRVHILKRTPSSILPAIPCTGKLIQKTEGREKAKIFQPNVCVTLASNNECIAKTPPGKISLQTIPMTVEATRTEKGLENSSLFVVSSSLVGSEIGVPSTPPIPRGEPTLASPMRLGAEAKVQSTPPTSPMKLSSPPPLKPARKVNRISTKGVDAPFRNPWYVPIRRGLSTTMSPLPPSSPPPMLASSPPPSKRPRVDSDTEEQPRPKVRRTGQSTSSPFVSPLRNAQGTRAQLSVGGISTPLRPSIIRHENFSSPILPTQPDVFTTPATAARSSPAYRLPATLGSSPATSASTSYKLRPLRTVIRPFKPPAKSNRPTTATVQALRQRLQLLRNALRIRGLADPTRSAGSTQPVKPASNDEGLEALALQWRSAAQEAAQDLWALVRDSMGGDSWGSDSGGSTKPDGWGWSDKLQSAPTHANYANAEEQRLEDVGSSVMFTPPPVDKVHRSLLKNLNRPVVPRKTLLPPYEVTPDAVVSAETEGPVEDAEEDKPKYHTLGTLLTSLGIPHQVLGWQEDEGEFVN